MRRTQTLYPFKLLIIGLIFFTHRGLYFCPRLLFN
nr:MAG TPA: hypothetical protein [Caudoviricetes sp.]